MDDGELTRLVAWSQEMRDVHTRLRAALAAARETYELADLDDLLVYCHGFCAALTGHHEGEDRLLFPAVAAAHPELAGTLDKLRQDHSMIGYLLGALQAAVDRRDPPDELQRHLEGVAAIMESHFRFEERQLRTVLETLSLDATPAAVFGPL